ncbi:MAG TPA: primosomal protein N' [Mariprofundaceae bacterium]|nr:primosomal protein N' [Mariprofundaceae bacterium]
MIVEVAVFAPLWQSFDYIWDEKLGVPEAGIRIVVPFGFGKRVAVVLRVVKDAEASQDLKTVIDRFDMQPLYDEKHYTWLKRATAYHLCTLGEMYELGLAWAAHDKQRRFKCVDQERTNALDQDLSQAFQSKRTISLQTIAKNCASEALQWRVLQAVQQGILQEVIAEKQPIEQEKYTPVVLRESQQQALDKIEQHEPSFQPLLLFGCTGSGKTEVYLQAANRIVQAGKQVLILVPEIGLTPMWTQRLKARFSAVNIWHSGMTTREKICVRHSLTQTQVLLGTRSALFLPLPNLGLIVIDEEHDTSFKQQDGVAYSARDMALLLAQELNIPLILGSATPSLESWRRVQDKTMDCVRLTERVHQHTNIQPEIIDMRGSKDVLSPALLQKLKVTHERGEQSMLYLNRRGYAPALQCTSCGDVPTCKACSLRLTLHRKQGVLRCHICDYSQRAVKTCKQCGEQAYLPLGSGTERLEDDLLKALPDLKLARFDRDVIRNPKDLQQTLAQFEAGEIDCLVGTQMLVKGHHFPNVTLVGVINADLGMSLPDFRASERWWQQMTQVFGRTGRGAVAGQVVVQTWSPDAPWFNKLDESKAEEVLNEELALRKMTQFPPYARWVRIVFSATHHEKAIKAAKAFAQALQAWHEVKVSGPMPCALERLAGRFRFEIIVRDASRKLLPWKLLPLLQKQRVPSGVRRKVDVDPQDLM